MEKSPSSFPPKKIQRSHICNNINYFNFKFVMFQHRGEILSFKSFLGGVLYGVFSFFYSNLSTYFDFFSPKKITLFGTACLQKRTWIRSNTPKIVQAVFKTVLPIKKSPDLRQILPLPFGTPIPYPHTGGSPQTVEYPDLEVASTSIFFMNGWSY